MFTIIGSFLVTAVEYRVTVEVLPRPGPIAVPSVWLGPRDGFAGSCNSPVRFVSAGANEAMTRGEFVATRYHARGCGCRLRSSPEGTLWLVAWKGERTESDQQTGGFASVRPERDDPRGVDSRSRGARGRGREDPGGVDSRSQGAGGRGPRRGGLPQPRGQVERIQEGWTPAAEGPGGEDTGGVDSRSRGARGRGPRRGGLPQPRGRGEKTKEGWTPATSSEDRMELWTQSVVKDLHLNEYLNFEGPGRGRPFSKGESDVTELDFYM